MESDILQVNLADRADVRAKLPDAEAILDRKLKVLGRAQADADFWRGHVEYMTRVAGLQPEPKARSDEEAEPEPEGPDGASTGAVSPVELVVNVVNREGRKIRSRDVGAILRREGHRISNTSVSNALYYAASERGGQKVQQVTRGWYAPLTFQSGDGAQDEAKSTGGINLAAFGDPATGP